MPAETRASSVSRRLLGLLLLPLGLLLGIGLFVDYRSGAAAIHGGYDRALREMALAIGAHLHDANDDGRVDADLPPQAIAVLRADSQDDIHYAVRTAGGELVSGDADLVVLPPTSGDTVFRDARLGGEPIRIVELALPVGRARVTIAVAETLHKRSAALRHLLASSVITDLVQLLGTLLLVWLGVRYGVRPLRALGEQIAQRSALDLAPLRAAPVPAEVRPLVHTLNALFATVREAARAQQQFIADAAHQVRTPLAGIIAQLDTLEREPMAESLRLRLRSLHDACVRLAHTANQLLALARSERTAITGEDFTRVDLAQLAQEVVAHELDRSLGRGIDLGAEVAPAIVRGNPWLLRELLANLVDNALAYTPRGGHATVRSGADASGRWLEVEDDGPGIAPHRRDEVRARFARLPGSPGDGCGLGLAIVDEIARVHDARFVLEAGGDGRGTRARITFADR